MIQKIITLFCLLALLSFSNAMLRPIEVEVEGFKITSAKNTLNYVQGAGYVVPVTFKDSFFTRNRDVVVSLYNSNMLFTENCFQFSKYDCGEWPDCKRDSGRTFSFNYPHFVAQGNLAKAVSIIDKSYWALANNAPALIATSCAAPLTQKYGKDTYGILGLGAEGLANSNFNNKVSAFSVYWDGKFNLEFNPSVGGRNLIVNIRTDANWNIPNVYSMGVGNLVNRLSGVRAIFDLNSDTIGLPAALYATFIQALGSLNVFCQQGFYQPICIFHAQLPNISFSPDGSSQIVITPQMYALNISGNQFKLNFRALSTTMTDLNYVTPQFASTIILGNTVLGNYYNYFNVRGGVISLYQP